MLERRIERTEGAARALPIVALPIVALPREEAPVGIEV
jgi:hypothetical protein